jgi:hypothetical protein
LYWCDCSETIIDTCDVEFKLDEVYFYKNNRLIAFTWFYYAPFSHVSLML